MNTYAKQWETLRKILYKNMCMYNRGILYVKINIILWNISRYIKILNYASTTKNN